MPRRLSGKPSKQSRNDPRRVSSGRIYAPNRIPRFLRIPDLPLERGFIPTVAFGTHRNGRNRDSFAFRTAGVGLSSWDVPVLVGLNGQAPFGVIAAIGCRQPDVLRQASRQI